MSGTTKKTFPFVGVHLDLKYLMPRKAYLKQWVRRLPELGINTLLLEYEDKFPFRKYPFLRAEGAFTPEELDEFLSAARGAGLRVVPLVQSLSHLEFALAHEELARLRELPHILTQINPGDPEAVAFVNDLIDEVLTFHEPDEYVHVGGDEAWHLGHNQANREHVRNVGKTHAWAEHERPILQRLIDRGKRPIIWDDALWDNPPGLGDLGLPPDTILHSWDYGTTDAGASGGKLRRVDAYQDAGHQVLGGPCLNWGMLTPRHQHCLDNTAAWAQQARRAGLLGLINTAWACFHVLPHVQPLYVAATGQYLRNGRSADDEAWQREFLAREFGTRPDGLPEAMADLGQLWELAVEGMGRPITPVLYGYMDLLLHFGSQEVRRARGTGPLDWGEVDFDDIHRRKMRILREVPQRESLVERLNGLEEAYGRSQSTFERLAGEATSHEREAQYWWLAADIKLLHTRIVRHELTADGNGPGLLEAWQSLGPRIERVLSPFMEDCAVRRAKAMWWPPAVAGAGEAQTQ